MKRREFLAAGAAATALMKSKQMHAEQSAANSAPESRSTEASSAQAASRIPRVTHPGTMEGEMLFRELGSTGQQVSVIGLGFSQLP